MSSQIIRETRFDFIDCLRGIAILGVVAVHVGAFHRRSIASAGFILGVCIARGAAVLHTECGDVDDDLRQPSVLDGPVLCPPLLSHRADVLSGPRRLCRHRRYGAEAVRPDGVGLKQVLLTLTFMHGWSIDSFNSVVPGGWSIACEAMFYFCFPLLLRYIRSVRAAAIACAASILLALAWSTLVKTTSVYDADPFLVGSFIRFSFIFNLLSFLSGILLYYALCAGEQHPLMRKGSKGAWILLLVSSAVLVFGGASGFSSFRNP